MAPPNPKRPTGKSTAGAGSGGGGGGGGKQQQRQPEQRKRGGFRVGPQNAPKDAYLGKAKKIKETLIKNAKLKRQFAKTLKAEGLSSSRLERGDTVGASGKGKGRGRAPRGEAVEAGDGEEEDDDDDDDDDDETSTTTPPVAPAAAATAASSSSRGQTTSLVDLPHDTSPAGYRPNVRQPMSVHAVRPGAAATSSSSTPAAAAPSGGRRPQRPSGGADARTEVPPAPTRWAPAKDAKGKARQPKMADKMDAMLAKIRKGL